MHSLSLSSKASFAIVRWLDMNHAPRFVHLREQRGHLHCLRRYYLDSFWHQIYLGGYNLRVSTLTVIAWE